MVMGQAVASTEVLVIGGGPGGYVAAIRLAQLGYEVMLVDAADELGGMCLHHGCIPSKALIHAMKVWSDMHNALEMGISVRDAELDFTRTQAWKHEVIDKLHNGIRALCKKHNIQVLKGFARFQTSSRVVLEGEGLDVNAVEFRNCIVATGSHPRELKIAPYGGRILSSREFIELDPVPKSLCVIGGGYIGIELGAMMAKAGANVTVYEAGPTILGAVEPELAEVAAKKLSEHNISVRTNVKIERVDQDDHSVKVFVDGTTEQFDYALVAIGHVPSTAGLQLELAGVEVDDHGFIKVDEQRRTSQKHIFAVGDVTGGMMLAHKASAEGRVAAEAIAGKPAAFDPQAIPAVIFSDPEIATVGLREDEAREQFGEIKVGQFPFAALGKALAVHEPEGFVKIVANKEGIVLGVHMVGPGVTDYVSEAALAIEMAATVEDVARTIHPHPTLAESLSEAAEVVMGEAIHLYQPKE